MYNKVAPEMIYYIEPNLNNHTKHHDNYLLIRSTLQIGLTCINNRDISITFLNIQINMKSLYLRYRICNLPHR